MIWNLSKEGNGAVTFDSPRTRALIGFLAAQERTPQNLSAEVSNPFCALALTSLDDQPIASIARVLLTTSARVANTSMEWNNEHTGLADWGGPPTRIEPMAGAIQPRGLRGTTAVVAQPLKGAGLPLGEPPHGMHDGDQWRIAVREPATTWHEIAVQR